MGPFWQAIIIFVSSTVASTLGTMLVRHYLCKRHILDIPNSRSNHVIPVPRGGGLAVVGTILCLLIYSGAIMPHTAGFILYLAAGMTAVALVSFIDDIRKTGLGVGIRLTVQLVAVLIGISAFPQDSYFLNGWFPWEVDRLLAVIGWLWFINLYNFMDGIDGITGSQTVTVMGGIAMLAVITQLPPEIMINSLIIAGAALGFLLWNWHPARIFIGDVGSVTLGYAVGWMLLWVASYGYTVPCLLFTAYYLSDSSITLLKRILRGKPVWEGHSEHYYQHAVRAGLSHASVVRMIIFVNLALTAAGLFCAIDKQFMALYVLMAGMLVTGFLFCLKKGVLVK